MKYLKSMVTFEEIPTRVTLSVSITNCRGRCVGCHSAELRENIGTELTHKEIDKLIYGENGVNCFLFLGEGNNQEELIEAANYIKNKYHLDVALYSGRKEVENIIWRNFDFVKVGPYIPEFGPLNKVTTNQRIYHVENGRKIDITYLMWKNGGK